MPQYRCLPLFCRPVPAHHAPVLYKYLNYTKPPPANQYKNPVPARRCGEKQQGKAQKMPRCRRHHGGKRMGRTQRADKGRKGPGTGGASAGGRPSSAEWLGAAFGGKRPGGGSGKTGLLGGKRGREIGQPRTGKPGNVSMSPSEGRRQRRDGKRSACRRTWPRADGCPPGGGTVWAQSRKRENGRKRLCG